ncbi:RNA polymerase subunit sigma [Trinickia caryophylli]|uniref:Lipoprotein n=1 Tax=Trinickia caryophylli TaxID=28094 RepID=A0A1X7DUR2_TRICW|nr:hypothetical protein [Trinickia caryophylli]PMS09210.1 RNA polymerase subunit sigma [Trinickia caryophylli]TRX17991.1 RNA polymerase subunit sigma [Trinickia caryophylli]WQE11230.1 RNA polymerase subunit sigma [Trinickia caryophylli]SMF22070.1 hypothetical protein SAMN06295900_10464 [Trinickia caryophylli]GLU32375.1 hypothetical protein Busp01_22170 [Trinickia caryophylli]
MNDESGCFSSARATQPLALRRSPFLAAATFSFALLAGVCVHLVAAPRGASLAGAATLAALWLAARAHARRQPAALVFEPGGIAAHDLEGRAVVHGAIAGCMHWAGRLLVISVRPHGGGRAVRIVVASDALGAEAFRECAVRVRQAAHSFL